MLEISADCTDYTDYLWSSGTLREDQNTRPANSRLFAQWYGASLNRNLRNLCNLRIFNLGLSSADRC
jgi:hypothetical protein